MPRAPLSLAPRAGLVCAALLLAACSNPAPDDAAKRPSPVEIVRIVSAEQALETVHVATVDPAPMVEAEIRKAIGEGPRCVFRYTSASRPVLALRMSPKGASGGVLKLKGNLVLLDTAGAAKPGTLLLRAGPIHVSMTPDAPKTDEPQQSREAEMVFEVPEQLFAGYRGYFECGAAPPLKPPRG